LDENEVAGSAWRCPIPSPAKIKPWDAELPIAEGPSLQELFDRYVGTVLARQASLADKATAPYWEWKLFEKDGFGMVEIPALGEFEMQFLGSESFVTNTWLHGWANNSVPDGFVRASSSFSDHFDSEVLFTEPQLPLDAANGDFFCVIGCEMLGASTYAALPNKDNKGDGFWLVFDLPLVNFRPTPLNRINTIFAMMDESTQIVDRRTAMREFLIRDGFSYASEEHERGFTEEFTNAGHIIRFEYQQAEDENGIFYTLTRNYEIGEQDLSVEPTHPAVEQNWNSLIRAPLSRPVKIDYRPAKV
jgi:hypothetical protein